MPSINHVGNYEKNFLRVFIYMCAHYICNFNI